MPTQPFALSLSKGQPERLLNEHMESLYLLIPVSALLVLAIIGVFAWALHGGQFDDLDAVAERILADDAPAPAAEQALALAAEQALALDADQGAPGR
jgi:cbb3-type cytochrome oxidase maturation protein